VDGWGGEGLKVNKGKLVNLLENDACVERVVGNNKSRKKGGRVWAEVGKMMIWLCVLVKYQTK
jgi:hypothetical protein